MKLEFWKAKDLKGNEVTESIIDILTALLTFRDPKDLPRGFKQALIFSRILKAFENKKELMLDDEDYNFLKEIVDTDTPAIWGSNKNAMDALTKFNSL